MENFLEERLKANKHNFFQKVQTEQFLRLLNKKSYSRVLEVGCGRGFWNYVGVKNKKFINCYGCDTEKYTDKLKFKKITGKRLPYKDNFFDLVFSMDVLEHVEDDESFLKEHIRVCKYGGEIIIGTPNYWRITNILLLILGRLKFPKNLGRDYYGDCIHLREYTIKGLKEKILEAKGRNLEIYPTWMGILFLSLGIEKVPGFLKNYCHFIFAKFKKR